MSGVIGRGFLAGVIGLLLFVSADSMKSKLKYLDQWNLLYNIPFF